MYCSVCIRLHPYASVYTHMPPYASFASEHQYSTHVFAEKGKMLNTATESQKMYCDQEREIALDTTGGRSGFE